MYALNKYASEAAKNSMSPANVIPKIPLWYSNNSLACKMKCRTHSHQLKLQFNLYKCILFKPSRDANIQSKKKRCNLHMRCAFIYQLIHCDVARYANKICNRLKPTAAFIFFFPSIVGFIFVFASKECHSSHKILSHQASIWVHLGLLLVWCRQSNERKWNESNVNFTIRLIAFTLHLHLRVEVNHLVNCSDSFSNRMSTIPAVSLSCKYFNCNFIISYMQIWIRMIYSWCAHSHICNLYGLQIYVNDWNSLKMCKKHIFMSLSQPHQYFC